MPAKFKKGYFKRIARKLAQGKYNHTYYLSGKLHNKMVSRTVGFPESMSVPLRYDQSIALASITNNYLFRGNSVFDPDFTGSGNQPNYFDNYAAIYQQYRVRSSSITVRFYNASATIASRVLLMPSDTSTPPANVMNGAGNPFAKNRILGTTVTGSNQVVLKGKMSTSKINGKTPAQVLAGDQYQSVVTSNPSDPWFWIIMTEDLGLASAQNLLLDVSIVYQVDFTDKTNVNLS